MVANNLILKYSIIQLILLVVEKQSVHQTATSNMDIVRSQANVDARWDIKEKTVTNVILILDAPRMETALDRGNAIASKIQTFQ